jgi:hypothetical protein
MITPTFKAADIPFTIKTGNDTRQHSAFVHVRVVMANMTERRQRYK